MKRYALGSGRHLRRVLWFLAGAIALVTGIVGVVVPVLPTVPFMLLAAFFFSRSCTRCERWLLEHPRFGPPLRTWREQGALSRRAKRWALASMAAGCAIAWWLLDGWVRALPMLVCSAVALWLWQRPEPAPGPGAAPPRAACKHRR